MNLKEKIFEYAKSINIPQIGVCDAGCDEVLVQRLSNRRKQFGKSEFEHEDILLRANPSAMMEGAKSVIVCLFPYYISGLPEANLSRYARVIDYHLVAHQKLMQIVAYIQDNVNTIKYKILVDNGPLVDRHAAYKAGLGFWGKNNQLINDVYGSYFFIGSIITDLELEFDKATGQSCINCGRCIKQCPSGAIVDGYGFHTEKCVSYITQKKVINEKERLLLEQVGTVYGCDICQECCPHNQNVAQTPILEFYQDILNGLSYDELTNLSNKEFINSYGKYPFAWRGKKTLVKNFPIQNRNFCYDTIDG